MRKLILILPLIPFVFCCYEQHTPETFSEDAKNELLTTLSGDEVQLKAVLEKYKGKTILVDVWASWCKDCLNGISRIKELQRDYPEVVFVFLSVDKNQKSWKNGVTRLNLKGEQYFLNSGWEGPLAKFLKLNWIPRYLIIDKKGNIKLFKATNSKDKRIKQHLK